MTSRDPKCVFVANSVAEATVAANWLEHEGVSAQVMDALTHGGLEGLTAWTGASSRGVEVWVVNPGDVETARDLISKMRQAQSKGAASDDEPPILAYCEECGRSSEFPGNLRGAVEDCPHCGRYMDVEEDSERSAETLSRDELPEGSPSMLGTLLTMQKPIILFMLGGCALFFLVFVFGQALMDYLSTAQ